MALNKKQASMATRIGIAIVAVILVISFVPGLVGLFGSGESTQTDPAGQLQTIAQKYSQTVQYNEQLLASDPTSYTVLVQQGNVYFDWAYEALSVDTGSAMPMWGQAIQYYERALSVQPGDPAMMTDLAIAYDFSGRTDDAIAVVRATNEAAPQFAPAYYHLGRFLQIKGDTAGAIEALQTYLAMDPTGQTPGGDPADAQARLSQLSSAGGASQPTTPQTTP
ncbi:MAG: tetratricopeptide repeat protein [Coriobacteriia bacterium]|nr:tetratricopeptide repeat protein [Coriobacteriia bacterium]